MISGVSAAEGDDRVQAVAEFRREQALDRLVLSSPSCDGAAKPMAAFAASDAPALVVMIRITLRKSTLRPLCIGQRAVVHHLQQDVEQVRVRLLDLVEQQHAVRVLVDAVGQQAALVKPT
jgi:hypothetical protein